MSITNTDGDSGVTHYFGSVTPSSPATGDIWNKPNDPDQYYWDGADWVACSDKSQTFSYTGAEQTFTVPAGVTSVTIEAVGAAGGRGAYSTYTTDQCRGGGGAYVVADIGVTPGETLYVYVGGMGGLHGANRSIGGYNGGGNGRYNNASEYGGGGGGATDVRQGGNTVSDRIIVAGGGGGGGNRNTNWGGDGGDPGADGANSGGTGGGSGSETGGNQSGGTGNQCPGGGGGGANGGSGGGNSGGNPRGGGGGSSLVPSGGVCLDGYLTNNTDPTLERDGYTVISWIRDNVSPPLAIGGLRLWVAADMETGYSNGDPVSGATDQSGNGFDASIVGTAPLWLDAQVNGQPAFDFDTGYMLFPSDLTSGLTEGEIFVVMKTDNDPGASGSGRQGGFWTFGSHADACHYPWIDGSVYDGWGSTTRKTVGNPTPALNAWHVLDVYSAAGDWGMSYNGNTLYTTATNTVGFSTGPALGTSIGTYRYEGLVAEVIMFDHKLDSPDYDVVVAYLNDKYDLGVV